MIPRGPLRLPPIALGLLVASAVLAGARAAADDPKHDPRAASDSAASAAPDRRAADTAVEGARRRSRPAAPDSSPDASPDPSITREGRPYELLGHGPRRRDGRVWYHLALYVDEAGARRAFPALVSRAKGRTRDKLLAGDKAPPFVVWGDFGKLAVMTAAAPLPAADLRAAFAEGLGGLLVETAPPDLRERAQAFLSLLDHDLAAREVLELHTAAGGAIDVTAGGARRAGPTDARLARALWQIWLGERPVSTELRRQLVDRVDRLGR